MKTNCYNAYSGKRIANEFIKLSKTKKNSLTHMQIQKLVYFAHAMSLATYERPLVRETFQAWPYGPVNVAIYQELQGSGKKEITKLLKADDDSIDLDEESKNIIEAVYNKFGKKNAWELSEISHNDSPWKKVFQENKSNAIQNEDIIEYYKA
ncbi:DUF4065 domain-containing protein [Campylobacter sp. B0100352/1]|uniref:Panacea domain-containing protein n=1 Tax=Campylobacter sp. B0100352/1 TaxID=2735783 RepID=UPI001D3726F0|nr:DUF4065 domain-containing protein [Campylobacter sp. B0100352/1]